MTGPHLTPEREAEIREYASGRAGAYAAAILADLLAALDAERAAHAQARTALTDSTALLIAGAVGMWDNQRVQWSRKVDVQAQENQRILGLAVAEADKPHDGNER